VTYRLGLIGFPVQHSISPVMQQAALDHLGIDAVYELWPTPMEGLPERITSLRAAGVMGANVTVPYKQAVIEFLDQLSDLARRAAAVNTIIPRDGLLIGENTDIHGLAMSLKEAGVSNAGFAAVILGAGGAARATVLALESLGVGSITIANRSARRASELVSSFPGVPCAAIDINSSELSSAFDSADVVINATAVGWTPGEIPVSSASLQRLRAGCIVMDLTYRDTLLIVSARSLGLRTLDGLPMLVYQGARSLELWTARTAPVELMMRRAIEARSARS